VLDIVKWVIAVEILGLAVAPALRGFFGNRRDAALASRPVGLALAGWLAWALSVATPLGFSRGAIVLAVLVLAGISLVSRRRAGPAAGPFWGVEENRAVLYFWVPAAIFLLVRAAVPEVLGAEKFMDLAFLNSLTRWSEMPPLDPWMSERSINYYYWGYLLAATIAKAAGVSTFVAYNLAIATFAGYSFSAAACLGCRLTRGGTAAAIGAGFGSVFAGNVTGAFDAWARPFARDFDYWHASRVIGSGDTINEFPFFTFFHADLHPHLVAFPFFLAAFAVADRWIEAGTSESTVRKGFLERVAPFLLVALVAAAAIAANPWNAPAIASLLVFAGVARASRGEGFPNAGAALRGALTGGCAVAASLVLIVPYVRSFHLPESGIGKTHAVSGIPELLGVWGILFAVAAAGLLLGMREETEQERRRRDFRFAVGGFFSVILAIATKTPALAPLLLLAFLAGRAAWRSLRRDRDREGLFAAFLCLLALGMIAGCELVYLKDSYGDQLHRMNTVFKFYHQAWPLLGIAAVVFADRAWRATKPPGWVLAAILVAATFAALLYPATAIVSRLRQKDGAFSLDARKALGRRNPGDLAAIEWLEKNAPPGSVILEATGNPYTEYARISSHTGIPTVLGWANHEGLWRSNDPEVMKRLEQIRQFYSTADARSALEVLARYRVTYVVVGDLERSTYASAPTAALRFLQQVHPGQTEVYRVSRAEYRSGQ
jgi:YYY domain-containing protein